MKHMSFNSILCFVLISFIVSSVSAQTCKNTNRYFTLNGTYHANLRLSLSSLPSNVSSQGDFYYYGSTGQEPNKVYAVGMCIPGSTPNDCFVCIKGAANWLKQDCPNQTDVYYWALDPTLCLVRYSNISFSGSSAFLETTPQYLVYNTANIPTSNSTEFKAVWENLINRTIDEASLASSTSSSSDNYYKVGYAHAPWNTFQIIYVLMQCTPDISPGDCNYCLRQNVMDYQRCCMNNTGGYVMRPICFSGGSFLHFQRLLLTLCWLLLLLLR